MRLVTYLSHAGPRVAGRRGDELVDLNFVDSCLPPTMSSLLALGEDGMNKARQAIETGEPVPLHDVKKIVSPVYPAGKIICIGLNYADHAAESGAEIPSEPVVFNKFPTALCANGDPILLPAESSKVDYEAELVAVVGIGGRRIPEDQAMQHIAGYCCGHDVSARDWQKGTPGGQWLLGKTFDNFAPLGTDLVTSDEISDPHNLRIQLRLNGETMQDSSTSQLIFSVPQLVAHISKVCTLEPGDLIFTGTPPGVGAARKPPVFLQDGDQVEVEIEKIGVLSNPVVADQ